jgi:hypothetical protein
MIKKTVFVICLSIGFACSAYAADNVQQGANEYDWNNCINDKTNDCKNDCTTSSDIDCQSNCDQLASDKCKSLGLLPPSS